jgi:spore maturation protein CgeB
MRILYCGSLASGRTCLMRKKVLEEFGHEVFPFDTDPYYRMGGRYLSAIFRRLQWGPNFSALHRILVREADTLKPDVVWIDKGILIGPETLKLIKQRNLKILLVHYTGDPLIRYHRSRSFLDSIPLYDILFTTKEYELVDYKGLGAQNLKLVGMGFSRNDHRPIQLTENDIEELGSDISFIGHCEPWYVEQLSPLLELNVRFAIWGPGWHKAKHFKRVYRGNGVYGEEYTKAICASKISIGLLSKLAPDDITTRTLEIPACGTFLLAERTQKHQRYFRESEEAEFFSDGKELLEKCRYYLEHDEERQRIASAGRQACLTLGYSYHDRMRAMMGEINKLVQNSARIE